MGTRCYCSSDLCHLCGRELAPKMNTHNNAFNSDSQKRRFAPLLLAS